MIPKIKIFKELKRGDIFKALDTKTYLKTGWNTYCPVNAEYEIIGFPLEELVVHIDQIELIGAERISYDGIKIPFKFLPEQVYFLRPECSNWEVFIKISSTHFVYAFIKYVDENLNLISYKKWNEMADTIYIHRHEDIQQIKLRTWLKNPLI
ncbi:MAG: hypothetical protein IPM51_11635 [Sphingobacteriaceae bacterium]|nr:hypothetical protein [Sphingobacteriaceae bacterium]